MGSPLLFTEEFEVVIMIELVTEEMHGSDRNADLKLITSEPTVGKAKLSTRAKWRSVLGACRSALKKTLTAPALSETPVYTRPPSSPFFQKPVTGVKSYNQGAQARRRR